MDKNNQLHRIGTVSDLSGVPIATLRIWENNYDAFHPSEMVGAQRLYDDDTIIRAGLFKQLTDNGQDIEKIAHLTSGELNRLLRLGKTESVEKPITQKEKCIVVTTVGQLLTHRIKSDRLQKIMGAHPVEVNQSFADMEEALSNGLQQPCDILLIKMNSLHSFTQSAIFRLIEKHKPNHIILLYRLGTEKVITDLLNTGIILAQDPITDLDLANLVYNATAIERSTSWAAHIWNDASIPDRKYSDDVLEKVADFKTSILCECPKHVATLISQLSVFEEYSKSCSNKNDADAQMHEYLSTVAGTARALFEKALERLAVHEHIPLEVSSSANKKFETH